jgi:hypothetical protein
MNEVFDLNRWMLLVGKHWNENKKKYLLSLVAMAALFIIWFSFMMMVERYHPMHEDLQATSYFVGLFLVGCLFGSMLFADFAIGPKAIHHLSVPASALEKLLCALFYGILLFYISYTLIFYLVDFSMVKIANALAYDFWYEELKQPGNFKPEEIVNVFVAPHIKRSKDPNFFFYLLLMYLAVQAAYILGSVYFTGYSFIKTTIVLLLVCLFFVFYMANVLQSFMPRGTYNSLTQYRIYETEHYWKVVALPQWIDTTLLFLFKYALAPVFWIATYFRLKEKEV